MRRVWLLPSALLLTAAPFGVTAANADPLKPVTKWDLNYGDVDCAGFRNYKNLEGPITLAFRPSPNGETYEILVALRSPSPEFAQELQGSVDFGNGLIKAWLLRYRSPTKGVEVYRFRIPATDMAQARSATNVVLHIEGSPGLAFTLDAMSELLKGLDACTADLKRYWNMDGEKDGRIASVSRGDVRSVFTGEDYPSEAIKNSQEGTAQFLLLVDEKGKVAGCHVLTASGSPVLDAMGCVVIQKRATFRPARDATGKPVRSTFVTPPITWQFQG